ncbi:MAG: alpha/beta fold hydrolase [Sphingomonas sp.]
MADTLVLLHGANGSAEEMRPLAERMPAGITVFRPDWLGHGGRPAPDDDYGVDTIIADLELLLDAAGIGRCFLFGYSIGGYLALVLASRRPERARGVATLAARHVWHPHAVAHLVHLATPERLTRPGNPRAAELAAIHHPTDWTRVNAANRRLFASLQTEGALNDAAVRAIAAPGLVLNATADPLVPVAESHALAACFRTWRLGLFPGSAHPFRDAPLDDIATVLADFVRDVSDRDQAPAGT